MKFYGILWYFMIFSDENNMVGDGIHCPMVIVNIEVLVVGFDCLNY